MTRLEREGIVKITSDASLIEQLEALGYQVVGEEEVPEPVKEVSDEAKEAESIPKDEIVEEVNYTAEALKEMLKDKGIEAPSKANKAMLLDMAKAEGLI